MKKRLLAVGEFTELQSGYGRYFKEVLTRLHSTGKYEIAMVAAYVDPDNPQLQRVPWRVYPNQPSKREPQHVRDQYERDLFNQFGRWKFDQAVLDFKPDACSAIRDVWMESFIFESPLRRYFNLCWLNPVDGYPQQSEWMDKTLSCDNVFTYTDWGRDVLNKQAGRIVCKSSAPPSADPIFQPIADRRERKKQFGLGDAKIIGVVARNQARKCIPEILETFAKISRESPHDLRLYMHTSFPDAGFNIPQLLLEYEISSKVLFTYKCRSCRNIFPSPFHDAISYCPNCGNLSAGLTNVKEGCTNEELAFIFNLFDIFIQWAIGGGFEMPIAEAASCGIPVAGVDYSGMSDVIRKVGGIPIPPAAFRIDPDTGRYFAVPDNDILSDVIHGFFDMPESEQDKFAVRVREHFLKSYNWDATAKRWEEWLDLIDVGPIRSRWKESPRIHQIPEKVPDGLTNAEFARWLIVAVLGQPEKIGTYLEARVLRDLNYGTTAGGLSGKYTNEHSSVFGKPHYEEFNREKAYRHFCGLAEEVNHWERRRGGGG